MGHDMPGIAAGLRPSHDASRTLSMGIVIVAAQIGFNG